MDDLVNEIAKDAYDGLIEILHNTKDKYLEGFDKIADKFKEKGMSETDANHIAKSAKVEFLKMVNGFIK